MGEAKRRAELGLPHRQKKFVLNKSDRYLSWLPIPKLLAATTSAVPLTRSNVSREALPAIVSTEKISRKIINAPNSI